MSSLAAVSEPIQALKDLLTAEKAYSTREKLSSVYWFKDVWRLKASAIVRVWRAVIWFTLWSIFVSVADLLYDKQLGLTNNVVPLMTVIVRVNNRKSTERALTVCPGRFAGRVPQYFIFPAMGSK